MHTEPQSARPLADDLIEGADALAEFIYGHRKERRKVYHLAEKGDLPLFRLGAKICGRKSAILKWISEQERRANAA
jgi:hypothetical protein